MQTKKQSLHEAIWHTIIGYLCAIALQAIVYPFYGWDVSMSVNMQIGLIFMIASLIRSYIIRRFFTWWNNRKRNVQ